VLNNVFKMNSFHAMGIKDELPHDIADRVIEHRNRFRRFFIGKMMELLPTVITYVHNGKATSINFLKLEVALRHGYNVVIGKNKLGHLTVLGHVRKSDTFEIMEMEKEITKDDITFTIPERLIPNEMNEIKLDDDCSTGNFVILKNKPISYTNDYEILEHYADELTELVVSRFSIIMQAKISTFFIGDQSNSETINQIVASLWNGSPYIKTSKYFDPKQHIHTIENQHLASMFTEIKREYQNRISEMINALGFKALGVDKESGVSHTEAVGNQSFTAGNGNVYLQGREPIKRLEKRYGIKITPIFNDEVISESFIYEIAKEGGLNDT